MLNKLGSHKVCRNQYARYRRLFNLFANIRKYVQCAKEMPDEVNRPAHSKF